MNYVLAPFRSKDIASSELAKWFDWENIDIIKVLNAFFYILFAESFILLVFPSAT